MTAISKRQRRQRAEQDRQRQRAQARQGRENEQIDQLIAESGWAVCVTELGAGESLAYTIGRSIRGKPELCTWARDKYLARDVVNLVAGSADHEGLVLGGGQVVKLGNAGYLLTALPAGDLGLLEYARERYTFLRALSVTRVA